MSIIDSNSLVLQLQMVGVYSDDLAAFPHCLSLIMRQVFYGSVDLNQQTSGQAKNRNMVKLMSLHLHVYLCCPVWRNHFFGFPVLWELLLNMSLLKNQFTIFFSSSRWWWHDKNKIHYNRYKSCTYQAQQAISVSLWLSWIVNTHVTLWWPFVHSVFLSFQLKLKK